MRAARRPDEIPTRDQGEPLPPDAPYSGQWVHKPIIFLYDRPVNLARPTGAHFSAGFKLADGEWCAGFDAEIVADALGLAAPTIWARNRAGALFLAPGVLENTLAGQSRTYRFRVDDNTCFLTIAASAVRGRA